MRLSGFTYIEVIVSVALMLYIGITASPFYGNFLFGQETDTVTQELRGSLVKARLYTMAGKEGDSWGVVIDQNRVVLFKGSAYGEDHSFDEIYSFSDRVTVSGLGEVVFARRTGAPSTEAVITVSSYVNADTPVAHVHTLTINTLGGVEENF